MKGATRLLVSTFGGLVAVAGIEHGIGEVLQGSVRPGHLAILSWPGPGPFQALGGEPAMTLLPSLLAAGIFTILVSAAFLVWAALFIERRHGALVLLLLCIPMLLAGGGFSPPILGAILAAAASRINAPLTRRRKRLDLRVRHVLAAAWPWSFGICLIAWLLMFPGLVLLNILTGLNDTNLVLVLAAAMLGFLVLTMLTGFMRDAEARGAADEAVIPAHETGLATAAGKLR